MSIEEGKIERFNVHDSSLCEIWTAEQRFLDQLDAETDSVINEFLSMFGSESFGDQLDDGEQVDAKEPGADGINGYESENLKVNGDETICKKTAVKVGSEFVVGIAGGIGFEFGVDPNLDPDLAETFVVFDGNGDGLITAEELQFVMCSLGLQEGQTAAGCWNMIHQVHMEGDGMVNYVEFKEMKALFNGGSKNLSILKLFRCLVDWDKLLEVIIDHVNRSGEFEKDAKEADPFGLDQTKVKKGKKAMGKILQKEGVVIDWQAWKRLIRTVLEQRLKPCNVGLFSK